MSLSPQVVDRLFDRLTATYGRDFTSKFEGVEPAAIRTLWAHELGSYNDRLRCIAWALENLPERPPNVIEFRGLCRRAPGPEEAPQLAHCPAGMARVNALLADVAPRLVGRIDSKEWARRIIANDLQGIRSRSSLPLKMAKAALGEQA